MRAGKAKSVAAETLIAAAMGGELDEAAARRLYDLGPEVVTWALLAAGRRICELQTRLPGQSTTPSTPSGMVPVYAKTNAPQRRKRPGAKPGHPGTRRPTTAPIDRRVEHRLKRCPPCDGPVQRCHRQRTHIIEDIPEHITPVVTEHTIHRDYCPACRKHVEPVVPDALPGAALGHHLIGLTSWLHYGLGVTRDQIVDILGYPLHTRLTPGGLIDAWRRLATVLIPWYEQIAQQAKTSAVLQADETGWPLTQRSERSSTPASRSVPRGGTRRVKMFSGFSKGVCYGSSVVSQLFFTGPHWVPGAASPHGAALKKSQAAGRSPSSRAAPGCADAAPRRTASRSATSSTGF